MSSVQYIEAFSRCVTSRCVVPLCVLLCNIIFFILEREKFTVQLPPSCLRRCVSWQLKVILLLDSVVCLYDSMWGAGTANHAKSLMLWALRSGLCCGAVAHARFRAKSCVIRSISALLRNMRHVYFMALRKCEYLGIKVGSSTNPPNRLVAIQYHCPQTLYIIHSQPETPAINERSIQALFRACNTHGEWFQYTKELSNYIASLMNP